MSPSRAEAFIRKHGIVLEAAGGPVPSLAHAIAGGAIKGSWWAHPRGREIFNVTRAVRASDRILVCRLVHGKVTLVHRRLWPALVRCAARFPPGNLAKLIEIHAPSGKHVLERLPFPGWVPEEVKVRARRLQEAAAYSALGAAAWEGETMAKSRNTGVRRRAQAGQGRKRAAQVEVRTINVPGYRARVDAAKYAATRDALMAVLPAAAPGLTQAEMMAAVRTRLPGDLFPGGAKANWWAKTVQLDLEARRFVKREATKPLRWHRTKAGSAR